MGESGNLSSLINRFNVVRQIPIFAKLNWFELQKIARKAIFIEHKKGEIVAREGDPPDFFRCLISGRLQTYTVDASGKKANVDFIHRGMHFGIISLLTGENHSLNYEALNDSVILKIPKDDFQDILKSIPHLGLEFSQSLSKRLRRSVKGTKNFFESTIFSIYSPVKDTGSSTYAINLALGLQRETKKKVIFVNIYAAEDEQPPSTSSNETAPTWETPAIELKDIIGDHDKIFENIIKDEIAIDLLHVVFDPRDTSLKSQISPLVSTLVGDYHYVVVDLPNDMDDYVLETLTQSDVVHLVSMDQERDLELTRLVINKLEETLRENFRLENIRIVIRGVHDQIYLSYEEINKVLDYDVYTMLPQIKPSELSQGIRSKSLTIHQIDPDSAYLKEVTRIAREMGGVMVGLVLGGGAALGVAHIGVIRVLEREKIPIDIVIGSSMGALIGSFWTAGKNVDELESSAREFEKKKDMLKLFDPVIPISGLVAGKAIRRWLKKHLGNKTFYSVRIPFKAVAYDLVRRQEIVIDSGSLVEAVRRSISIPGVIEPVKEKDQVIIDGGVLNPLPTNVLAAKGIKKIIAVNVLQTPEHASRSFDLEQREAQEQLSIPFHKSPIRYLTYRLSRAVLKCFNPNISDIIVRTLQASEYVIAEQSAEQADIVIHPELIGIQWFELNKVDELLKRGEEATVKHLAEIKALIEA